MTTFDRLRPAIRLLLTLTACATLLLPVPLPAQTAAQPQLDRLFERTNGWTGGDGCYSVALADHRLLWLFGDSWVGRVYDGRRTNAVLVNNALALQTGRAGLSFDRVKPRFSWGRTADGKPAAFFRPPDGRGWFWPLHGIETPRGLYLFLLQIERTDDSETAFAFRPAGCWLARITNPRAAPEAWRVVWRRFPWSQFTPARNLFFGSSVLCDGDQLYVYGVDEAPAQPGCPKELVVGRVPLAAIDRFDAWRFWADGRWHRDFRLASPILPGVATEFSVTRLPGERPFALVTTEAGLTGGVRLARSAAPQGPWSTLEPLFMPDPKERRGGKAFAYAAKAHPALAAKADELVISYVVNAFNLFDVVRDARLYWPRFIRTTVR